MNELTPTDLSDADLAAVGLTTDDVTPELLAGLERTGRMLAEAPVPAPPKQLVSRWDAALAELDARRTTPRPVVAAPRRHRPGRRSTPESAQSGRRLAGALGLAIAVAASVVTLVTLPGTAADPPSGPPGGPDGGRALSARELPLGGRDYGPLSDPDRLSGCLAHVGAPGASVLGARQVSWSGRPGVLLVLPTAVPGRLRVLVVSPDCGPGTGSLLTDTTAGR